MIWTYSHKILASFLVNADFRLGDLQILSIGDDSLACSSLMPKYMPVPMKKIIENIRNGPNM